MLMGWYNHATHSGIARYARDAGWILDSHSVHIGHHPSLDFADGLICSLYGQPELRAVSPERVFKALDMIEVKNS